MESNNPIPCIICNKALEPVFPETSDQPSQANSFVTHGTYGSEYFDPLDGSYIYINICDGCLEALESSGAARRVTISM